jgi:hypothetical protein
VSLETQARILDCIGILQLGLILMTHKFDSSLEKYKGSIFMKLNPKYKKDAIE